MRISDWSSDVCSSDLAIHGYPLDGVVLTVGCDKTTPACLMAAATVNLPAIALSVGPMLNGWFKGERTGSGTIVWKAREMLAAGEIDYKGFPELVASSAPSTGWCNTMGTATPMNSLTEALGMRSEEHTSELQSLMRKSYAVFCLKKKINRNQT